LEASAGPEHPDALDAKTHLATVYYAIGRPGEAIRVLKDVLQVQRRVLKVGHPATLKTMAWLGHTYVMTRDFAGAEPLLLEALTECRKALDPNHSTIEFVLASLSGMYAVKAKENKADPNLNGEYLRRTGEYLMEAAEINRLRHGPDDDLTDMANTAVLSFYRTTKHEDAAEPYAREHLEFCIRKKPDSADRYVAEANLGLCRLGRKAYSEAERSLLLAHEWITSRSHHVPPETLGQLSGIEERVIEFYQKDGNTKQADAWKLRRTNLGFPAKPSAPK
jgi:tetratricopeptide (TPR) repeat protein